MNTNNATLFLWIFLAAVVALAAWLAFSTAARRRKREELRDRREQQGFTPLPNADPGLMALINEAGFAPQEKALLTKNVFSRPVTRGRLYLFDLYEKKRDSSPELMAEGVMAITSPDLDLPRFLLIPRLAMDTTGPGFLMNAANALYDWAIRQVGMTELFFSECPRFQARFAAMGEDEDAAIRYFNAGRLEALASLDRPYQIDGCGPVLLLRPALTGVVNRRGDTPDEQRLIMDAERVLAIFR